MKKYETIDLNLIIYIEAIYFIFMQKLTKIDKITKIKIKLKSSIKK